MKIILKNKTESEIIFDKNDLDIISISFNIVHIDEEISSVIGCNESEFFTIYKKITNAVDNKTLFCYEEIRVIYSSITYCFHAVGLDKTKKIISHNFPNNKLWENLIIELSKLL